MEYDEMMEIISRNARKNNPENDSDYMKGGLLYCGKCNTPKQCKIEFMGKIMTPYCMCRCAEDEVRTVEAMLEKSQYDIKTAILRDEAFPARQRYSPDNKDMREWTFANQNGTNPKIMLLAERYAENFDKFLANGIGFLFYGNIGAGKSYVSASIVNAIIEKHYTALMTTFGRIRNEISDTREKNEYFNRLNGYSLLVVDDLFAEGDTEYMKEIVFQVIDERVSNRMPLIVTTNLTEDEIKNPANIRHKRILSRIKEVCRPIHFNGPDQRAKNAKNAVSMMKEIIGI